MTQLTINVYDEETVSNYANIRLVKLADQRRAQNKTVGLIENEDKKMVFPSVILHPGR